MRILVVHNRYRSASPSGENRVVDQESDALQAAGHEVEHFERVSDDIESFSWRQKALIPGQVVWSPSAAREIGRVLGSFRPDVVHAHNLFPMISPSVLHACRRHLVPTVVTLHNYRQICPSGDLFRQEAICHDCVGRAPIPAVRHGCYRDSPMATVPVAIADVIQKKTWQTLPSAYIFISASQRDLFASLNLPKERRFVKHNLVYPMDSEPAREPLIVYVGRLNEAKGLPLLMEAWDRFKTTNLRLAIAGGGPLENQVKQWADKRASVEALGILSRDECIALLARARAAVVPSQWPEPFGLVIAEAMSASVASIAPAHGSFPELIEDGVDGVLFAPGDTEALVRQFGDVENNPSRWAELGSAAQKSYMRRFLPETNVKQLESIYRFAIEHPVWIELSAGRATEPTATVSSTPRTPRRKMTVAGVSGTAPSKSAAENGHARHHRQETSDLDQERTRRSWSETVAVSDGVHESDIAGFWESHPCGDEMIGGLVERYREDFSLFFAAYDDARYKMESHIPGCLDALKVNGLKILEVGLGQGAESEQLIRRGARWTGLDLTTESVRRVQVRLELRDLPYDDIWQGSATQIPAPDNSFDLVFSHGVLHHVPDILAAQSEVHRVLRPGGRLVVMLYARRSLNYQVTIKLLRRAALVAAWPLHRAVHGGTLGGHLRNAEREGLGNYLHMERFLHANTDGPDNPFARVYDLVDIKRDFPDFRVTARHKEFMHAPPLPVHGLPGAQFFGWHLWVEMEARPHKTNAKDLPVPAGDNIENGHDTTSPMHLQENPFDPEAIASPGGEMSGAPVAQ
jgi:glycosyltransferase involved in cell wall biosynthesis/SAM-dependent methyltransferase